MLLSLADLALFAICAQLYCVRVFTCLFRLVVLRVHAHGVSVNLCIFVHGRSFGITLWEMFARDTPYPSLELMETALAVVNDGMRVCVFLFSGV